MELRINEDELKLLTCLRDHAKGFGKSYPVQAEDLAEAGLDPDAFTLAASYLEGWGFVLISHSGRVANVTPRIWNVCLSSMGEAYLREVDALLQEKSALQRGKRLGLAALAGIMDVGLKAAGAVLSDFAKRHV